MGTAEGKRDAGQTSRPRRARTLTIKGMAPALYERVKASAERNRRSLNAEIIVCIEKALVSQRLDPDELLARVAKRREAARYAPLDDAFLESAKAEGRP